MDSSTSTSFWDALVVQRVGNANLNQWNGGQGQHGTNPAAVRVLIDGVGMTTTSPWAIANAGPTSGSRKRNRAVTEIVKIPNPRHALTSTRLGEVAETAPRLRQAFRPGDRARRPRAATGISRRIDERICRRT